MPRTNSQSAIHLILDMVRPHWLSWGPQQPKLSPYIPEMVEGLSKALSLPRNRVNVKATTTEHLGFEGRKEGISAQAVCLIQEIPG